MKKYKILISGGGTGGHVFPAIAIANELKKRLNDASILFIGAKGKIEMSKVPEAGYPIEALWISGFQRNINIKNLSFPIKLTLSLLKSRKIIKKFKPDIAIGVGGYASGPALKMAQKSGIPTLIQEQNSFPGITNRLLSKSVDKICVAYEGMDKYFDKSKIVITGNPIREEVIDISGKRNEALKFFDLSTDKKTLLVIGGSQGAKSINESIDANLNLLIDNNIQIIWQTGKYYIDKAIDSQKKLGNINIKVFEFINRMDMAFAAADIVISRAGAIAISELTAVKKPVIFVPLPSAAEDHQTKNALNLVNNEAAILINDYEAKEKLGKTIIDLFKNENRINILKNNIGKMAIQNSAGKIVDEIMKLIEN
ncbi:MAG: undecaprenyldiphospho-muramoylpentapeptide beta-N-acetylglucosaminyltransferase [Bacteroidales bacterium]|nr:undecaprenyldiphospho-muramoylpentapeptide beta-N-acetylglucosaminyltransferase [Bacteroidales bacterium]